MRTDHFTEEQVHDEAKIDVGHVGLSLRQYKRFQGTLEENARSFATDAHQQPSVGEFTFHFDCISVDTNHTQTLFAILIVSFSFFVLFNCDVHNWSFVACCELLHDSYVDSSLIFNRI
jgi:hypothetical protein